MVSRSTDTSIWRTAAGGPEGPPLRSLLFHFSTSPLFHFRFGDLSSNRHVSALVDHERPQELDHDLPRLGEARGLDADDADVWTRFGFALLEHLAARVDGLALEERIR